MFGLPDEFLSKMGILGGNPDRAGIQVAFAHHDAADRHQRCSGKSEFFRTKHSCDHHISSGFKLAVGLQPDPPPEAVEQQGLVCFRKSQFPRDSCMLNGGQR